MKGATHELKEEKKLAKKDEEEEGLADVKRNFVVRSEEFE